MGHDEGRARVFSRHLATQIGAIGLFLAAPALALADGARFDIPAQPLSSALQAFAVQANVQLLYVHAVVAKKRGNEVRGNFDKHAALALLLRDTGF
jgi:outer membrane receptor for ferric coprogen and ferric-rhodotorulic acid